MYTKCMQTFCSDPGSTLGSQESVPSNASSKLIVNSSTMSKPRCSIPTAYRNYYRGYGMRKRASNENRMLIKILRSPYVKQAQTVTQSNIKQRRSGLPLESIGTAEYAVTVFLHKACRMVLIKRRMSQHGVLLYRITLSCSGRVQARTTKLLLEIHQAS